MPRDHVSQRGLQRSAVQLTAQPHRQRDHVGGAAPFQPVQEPQPPLRIRQRDLVRPRQRHQRRPRRLPVTHALRQALDGRRLEQAADRELHVQGRADPADQPRRQQRMAAQREEVVVDPDPLEPQHLRKQRAQHLLARRARTAHDRRRQVRRRQRTPVELAVRGERQPLQHHISRRHHVVRQARRHMHPQRRRIGHLLAGRHHIGHQPLGCRAYPRARSPPPARQRHAAPARPRSRQARSGTRAASPARPHGPGTPAPRQRASAPGRRSGTSGSPQTPYGSATNRSPVSPARPR